MSLIRSTATIGTYTMLSRVLGFIRDMTIATALGASMFADAFFVAFKIPNFLRRLFAEGAFNAAFVPLFSGMLAAEGKDAAKAFADEAYSFLVAVLILLSIFCVAAMPWLMMVLAPGFEGNPEKYDLTVLLTRITFPYIIFISVVSLIGGILNSMDKFAAVAATPIIMNLCLIFIPPLIEPHMPSGAHALAVAVFIAGVAQMLWLMWFAHKLHMLPRLRAPKLTAQVKRLLKLIAPAALGAGVAQINLFIDLIIASHIVGGVSYLYYADRINELPLAIIGIAIGTALLPMLSRQLREGKHDAAIASQNRAIELTLFLSIPAAIALMVIASPIIHAVYRHGAFSVSDANLTASALVAFAAGLPAFVLIKVLAPAFYARENTKTPFMIATICVAVNLILNLILIHPFAHVGMAMATTAAGWLNVVLMLHALHKRDAFTADAGLKERAPRILAAGLVMGGALYVILRLTAPYVTDDILSRAFRVCFLVIGGLAAYGVSAVLLHAVDHAMIGRLLRKKR